MKELSVEKKSISNESVSHVIDNSGSSNKNTTNIRSKIKIQYLYAFALLEMYGVIALYRNSFGPITDVCSIRCTCTYI